MEEDVWPAACKYSGGFLIAVCSLKRPVKECTESPGRRRSLPVGSGSAGRLRPNILIFFPNVLLWISLLYSTVSAAGGHFSALSWGLVKAVRYITVIRQVKICNFMFMFFLWSETTCSAFVIDYSMRPRCFIMSWLEDLGLDCIYSCPYWLIRRDKPHPSATSEVQWSRCRQLHLVPQKAYRKCAW